ncbi:hypothetical protein BsWGS_28944 [Bradybaena similaris]
MPAAVITDKLPLLVEFPENISISDLCDCGRHRSHHKPIQQNNRELFPTSDYMSTYTAIKNPKPRSSKRPQLQVRQPYFAPMMLSTSQREDFKNPGQVERTLPVIHDAKYEPSKQPLEQVTFYSQEFTPKQILSEPVKHLMSRRDQVHVEPGKFEDTTTNKEHFKRWLPQPQIAFGELPSFVGSLLFPGKENIPLSTTRQTYTEAYAPPAVLAKAAPDNLILQGDYTFDTTHNATYRKIEGDHRAKPLVKTDHKPVKRDGQFIAVSQTQQDFPGFKGGQPCPPKAVDPPQATIDLKCDNRQIFETENRTVFQGHDVTRHPVPDSSKKLGDEYKPPPVKFETETSHKKDYQPVDLKSVEIPRRKIPLTNIEVAAQARFDGRTTNSEFFHRWKVQPRIRYGDFYGSMPYLPPRQPFHAQTVMKTAFVAQPTRPIHIYRQRQQPVYKEGKMSFETEYQQEFKKKQRHMCPAAAFLIQQGLKRTKAEQPQQQQVKNKRSSSSQTTPMMASRTQVKG